MNNVARSENTAARRGAIVAGAAGIGPAENRETTMGCTTAADGAQIFVQERGAWRPVVPSHGWPPNADGVADAELPAGAQEVAP